MAENLSYSSFDGKPWFCVPDVLPNFKETQIRIDLLDLSLQEDFKEEADAWHMTSGNLLTRTRNISQTLYELQEGDNLVLRNSVGFKRPLDLLHPDYFRSEEALRQGMCAQTLSLSQKFGGLLIEQMRKFNLPIEEILERNLRLGLDVAHSQRTQGMDVFFCPALGTMQKKFFLPNYRDQKQ